MFPGSLPKGRTHESPLSHLNETKSAPSLSAPSQPKLFSLGANAPIRTPLSETQGSSLQSKKDIEPSTPEPSMFQTAVKGTAPSSPQSSQNASATRPQASTLVPVMNEKCKTCGSIVYFPTLHNCDSATLPSRPSSGASKSSASLSKAAPETVTLSDPSTRAQPASLASTNKAGSTATTSTRTPSVLDEAAARPTSVPSFSLNSANQGAGCVLI